MAEVSEEIVKKVAGEGWRRIMVDVSHIDWDTADYEEYDDDGNILNEEEWNLPRDLHNMELTVWAKKGLIYSQLDEVQVEDAIMDGLAEEYGFCVNMLEWKFVKYEPVKHETENYYYVWNFDSEEKVCNEDGNPYHFDTIAEAQAYIETLNGLMNE